MNDKPILNQPHQSDPYGARVVLLVPKAHVKTVKSTLEQHKRFDRYHGISPITKDENCSRPNELDETCKVQQMRVPTTIPHTAEDDKMGSNVRKTTLLAELQLDHLSSEVTISYWKPSTFKKPVVVEHNPLRKALREALEGIGPDAIASLEGPMNLTVDHLVISCPESYSIYPPLLLLSSSRLGQIWAHLIRARPQALEPVWQHVATVLHCTHIALNSPIPPSNTPDSAYANDISNILRSPVNLVPIYGSFGPIPTPQTLRSPSSSDLSNTLWVRTTQNGIHQTWAPLYTMFSRGNVKEKARILHLSSVASVTKTGGEGATAVDMYAGIGYFAFSYRKAGIKRVLCWELNPWSVEGLRRGAELNGWSTRTFTRADVLEESSTTTEAQWDMWRKRVLDTAGAKDFWIFHLSNDTAGRILECLRDDILPVRHVNLGLLPVSRLSWPSAVLALDRERGGWIHAHENVGVQEMVEREVEVRTKFQRLADGRVTLDDESAAGDAEEQKRKVQVEHIERVKMYAPGVVHVVFDVHISGTSGND